MLTRASIWLSGMAVKRNRKAFDSTLADLYSGNMVQNDTAEPPPHERRLEAVLQGIPEPIGLYQKTDRGLVFIHFNRAADEMSRGRLGRVLNATIDEIYADQPGMIEHAYACLQRRENVVLETDYRLAGTGETKQMVFTFAYVPHDLVLIHAHDITGRVLAERALRDANQALEARVAARTAELQAIIDGFSGLVFLKDREFRFITVNRTVEQLLGMTRDEIRGKTDYDIFPRGAADYYRAHDERVFQSGFEELEEVADFADGSHHVFLADKFVLRDRDGRPYALCAISHDISKRKLEEEERERLRANLQQRATDLDVANHEMESFSYSVSHDLRTPLSAIRQMAQVLAEDHKDEFSEAARNYVGMIVSGTEQMEELIQSLLKLSRLSRQPLHKQPVDMTSVVRSALESLGAEARRPDLTLDIRDLARVEADPVLLRQVWVNLIANALKFSRHSANPRVEIGCEACDGEDRVYYIRDTGVGFSMEQADKLFSVFQRLHGEDEYEGHGVGLAIVQRIVRRHGGRVWAEGEPAKGATFYFTLQ